MSDVVVDSTKFVEQLLPYERNTFLWLNDSHSVFWDSFMWIYSGKLIWIPLAITAFLVFTYRKPWRQSILFIACFVLLACLCDQLSANIIKPYFERLRPTHHPDFENFVVTVNGYRGGRFGFVSAHAANGFGIATFTSLIFKYRRYTLVIFAWAILTAYSRIYLGVHFITDILGGIVVGVLSGLLMYYLFQLGRAKILKEDRLVLGRSPFKRVTANILMLTIGVLVVSIFIASSLNYLYGYDWFY